MWVTKIIIFNSADRSSLKIRIPSEPFRLKSRRLHYSGWNVLGKKIFTFLRLLDECCFNVDFAGAVLIIFLIIVWAKAFGDESDAKYYQHNHRGVDDLGRGGARRPLFRPLEQQ